LWHEAQMRDLGCDKQTGAGIFTGCNTRAAANALSGVHCQVGIFFRHGNVIRLWRTAGTDADEPTRLLDTLKGLAIHHQVFDQWKRLGSERFDANDRAIPETAHIGLAGGHAPMWPVLFTVNDQRAGTADA